MKKKLIANIPLIALILSKPSNLQKGGFASFAKYSAALPSTIITIHTYLIGSISYVQVAFWLQLHLLLSLTLKVHGSNPVKPGLLFGQP
jgi:hypothetical protein